MQGWADAKITAVMKGRSLNKVTVSRAMKRRGHGVKAAEMGRASALMVKSGAAT